MTGREERGMAIAKKGDVTQTDNKGLFWKAASQSGRGNYIVFMHKDCPTCSCPDHESLGIKCKHIFAVEFTMKAKENPDGTATLAQTVTITETIRKTYKQDWPAYNAAQTNEKDKFQQLLHDLCRNLQDAPKQGRGRKPIPLRDALFSAVFKIYSTFSGRRFMTDLREAHAKGYISKLPCYNSIFNYLEMPELTPILKALIEESSRPLRAVESCFAGDSTGFSTYKFVRWFDAKYKKEMSRHVWVKCHLMCGVKTNVVTAVEIADAGDAKMLPDLLSETINAGFTPKEVSLDKGYLSENNFEVITATGAEAFIPFKHNSTADKGGLWAKFFHYFCFRQEEFLQHYHKRSNVESTYSMIKRKFGDHIRSKTGVAMDNEVLCKVLCHNICVLIQEMYELGIEPTFWGSKPEAEQNILPMAQPG